MGASPAKLYYLTPGPRATWGSPAAAPAGLTEIKSARDLKIPGTRPTHDTTDRGSGDFETEDTGKIQAKLTFQCTKRTTDAGRDALKTAFQADTVIALAILDGASTTAGTKGLWADCKVTKFEEDHPLKEGKVFDVEVTMTQSDVAPEWVEVTA